MVQILVRELDREVVECLKKRAKEHGRSLQSEVKLILEQAAYESVMGMKASRDLVDDIRRKFKGRDFPDSVYLVREDRDR